MKEPGGYELVEYYLSTLTPEETRKAIDASLRATLKMIIEDEPTDSERNDDDPA